MPSWELFAAQDDAYRESVLPPGLPTVSVEAGVAMGWERWVDASVAIDRFGASAPGAEVLEKLGITPSTSPSAVTGSRGLSRPTQALGVAGRRDVDRRRARAPRR